MYKLNSVYKMSINMWLKFTIIKKYYQINNIKSYITFIKPCPAI